MPSEETVVSELRAALLSSKTPLRIQDVNSDYKVLNGYSIPFKEFGHKSLEEFLTKLKEKGEVTMKYESGNLMVHAIPKGSSAHVTDMISKQKTAKKRGGPSHRGRGGSRFGGRGGRSGGYSSRSSYSSYRPPPASSYRPAPISNSYRPAPAFSNSYKSSGAFSNSPKPPPAFESSRRPAAAAYYPAEYKPGKPTSKPQPDFNASKKAPERSVNARLSKVKLVCPNPLPPFQNQLDLKVPSEEVSSPDPNQSVPVEREIVREKRNSVSSASLSGADRYVRNVLNRFLDLGPINNNNGENRFCCHDQRKPSPVPKNENGSSNKKTSPPQKRIPDYAGDYCEVVRYFDDDIEIIAELKRPAAREGNKYNVSSTLPPRMQKRLGPKVTDDDYVRQNSSPSPEEVRRIVRVKGDDWDRVVTYASSPSPVKSVDKVSHPVERKYSNAQANTLQSEAIAPRFQKKLDEKLANGINSSNDTLSSVPSQVDPLQNSSIEDLSQVVNSSAGLTRRPGDFIKKARANIQAKKVQQLAQDYLGTPDSGNTGTFSPADQSLRASDPSQSTNNQFSGSQLQNGHTSLPANSVRVGAPVQEFNLTWNTAGMINLPTVMPLNIATSGLTAQYPIPNRTPLLPTPNIPPLFPVNPGQPSYIPFSQPATNFIYPVNNTSPPLSQPNPLLAKGVNPGADAVLSNGSNDSYNPVSNGPSSLPPSNLSKPISGVSMRSATPAQDRLKRLHQPLNPDPKPPVPSSALPKVNEDTASPATNNVQSLANSVNSLYLNESQTSPNENSFNPESDPNSSPVPYVDKLSRLAKRSKSSAPTYKTISRYCNIERKLMYAAVVTVDPDRKYTTVPEEFSTEADAHEAAARAAFLDLSKKLNPPSNRVRWHSSTSSPYVICTRIAFLLEGRTNGIWSDEIPNMYMNQYKEMLADDWVNLVSDSSELEVIPVGGRAIITPKIANKFPEPPPLELPQAQHWDVYVTLACSTAEVWLRLIGDNYSEKYADLVDEMALSFKSVKPEDHVMSPEVGNYYAVQLSEIWFRVKVTEMKDGECQCHLIDNGDSDIFSREQLYTLDPIFLKLPAQAVKCSLHGLELYADSPQSQAYLNVIQGNTFIAEVKSREEPYAIELYDTSTDDNIHMGEELLQKFDAENSAPLLPPVGSIQRDVTTYVSHVSETGEIFLQFHTSHFEILKTLIDNITPEDEKANKITKLSDVDPEKLYLAKFSDEEWYRAAVTNINSEEDIEVFFIDYGNSHTVSLSELLSLDKLPNFLSLILSQAILVHLDAVPPTVFSEKLADKIRELVPEDEEVLVKRMTDEDIPKVEIFIRYGPSKMLMSVNNTIIVDPEFAKLAEEGKEQNLSNGGKESSNLNDDASTATGSSVRSDNSTPEPIPNTSLKIDAKPFVPKTSSAQVEPQVGNFQTTEKRDSVDSTSSNVVNPTDLKPFEVPVDEKNFLSVFVVNIATPHNFTVQTEDSKKTLEQLEKEMNNFYNKYNLSKKKDLAIGETYAVKQRGVWSRFTITQLTGDHCVGSFPDSGGFQMFPSQDIYPLMPTYKKNPVLAVRAKLADVKPKFGDWEVDDTLLFQALVKDQKLKCRVVRKDKNHLELDLYEYNIPNKNIAEQLINNDRAFRCF